MTRSGTDLLVEERRLFHDLFDRVLDQSIDDVWFRVDDPEFSGYPPTTWQQLADQANLAQPQQRYDTSWCYKFAPRGWLRGVKGLESDTPNWHALPTPDSVRDRLAMLCRTLKASIAGRNAPPPGERSREGHRSDERYRARLDSEHRGLPLVGLHFSRAEQRLQLHRRWRRC